MENQNQDYAMTLFEACEYLNKSSRTISRYVRRGVLHPLAAKSRQGTLEYRFSRSELEAIKKQFEQVLPVDFENNGMLPETPSGQLPAAQFASLAYAPAKTSPAPNIFYPNQQSSNKNNANNSSALPVDGAPAVLAPVDTAKEENIIVLLKETTEMLRGQLKVKDDQIKDLGAKIDQLIERGRETNILLKGMQDKVLRLEQPLSSVINPAAEIKETQAETKPTEIKSESATAIETDRSQPRQQLIENKSILQTRQKRKPSPEAKAKNNQPKAKPDKGTFFSRLFG